MSALLAAMKDGTENRLFLDTDQSRGTEGIASCTLDEMGRNFDIRKHDGIYKNYNARRREKWRDGAAERKKKKKAQKQTRRKEKMERKRIERADREAYI